MQKTDLNVSPYYDDFTEGSNFHRVLFRPAFSVQARELTQMQSILQNQIERLGSHFFKEGAVVIPGQVGLDLTYSFLKLQVNFTDSQSILHTVENYRTQLIGHTITGVTSKVKAKIVGTAAAVTSASEDLTLFIKYEESGTDSGSTTKFTFDDDEFITSDTTFSYLDGNTSKTLSLNTNIAKTSASSATGTGSAASVQKGVYYIRGHFVECATQTLVLDKYTATPSYRVGFTVTESLSTPEEDSSLLDNATGSTNFAAKGAHRLKYTLTLTKKALGSADDADFVELLTVRNGLLQSKTRHTDYSILEETLARRTFDESGNYIVRGFDMDMREHFDDGLNNGLYKSTDTPAGDPSKVAITLSPGKAYVRGFEIETLGQTVVPLDKARTTDFIQNYSTTFSAGNYLTVENTWGTPDIDSFGSSVDPFFEVELRDRRQPVTHVNKSGHITGSSTTASHFVFDSTERFPKSGGGYLQIGTEIIKFAGINAANNSLSGTITRGYAGTTIQAQIDDNTPVFLWGSDVTAVPYHGAEVTGLVGRGRTLGVARTRAFEVGSGEERSATYGQYSRLSNFQHYLFDVRMLCKMTMDDAGRFKSTNFVHNGARVKGSVSGATGIVYVTPQDKEFSDSTCDYHNTTTISMDSTGGLEVGMGVFGDSDEGIPDGAYITAITNSTTFTINAATTGDPNNSGAAVTNGTLTFGAVNSDADGQKIDSGRIFHVIQTTGTFVSSDVLTSNIAGDFANSGALESATYYTMNDVHSLFAENRGGGLANYVADVCPKDVKKLNGTVVVDTTNSNNMLTVRGTNTGFSSDLKVGDLIEVNDSTGTTKRVTVKTITNNSTLTTVETFPNTVTNSTITRVRSKLEEQEELVMLSKLPKPAIATLKSPQLNNAIDTSLKVRRQQTLQLQNGSGTITLPDGESWIRPFNADDYIISVHTAATSGTKPYAEGEVLFATADSNEQCHVSIPASGQTLSINLGSSGGSAATNEVLKVIFSVEIGTAQEKTKTLVPMHEKHFPVASGQIYGTNFKDEELSLGFADIFRVRGIFESSADGTPAKAPEATYKRGTSTNATSATQSGDIFNPGEKITGSNGAIARVVSGTKATPDFGTAGSTFSFCYLTTKKFTVGTTLTSAQNTSLPDLVITSVAAETDSIDILSNYQVDTGMRDTYYDIGRISRKPGIAPPTGEVLVVFDYFTHGAGDYFSVDSYPVGTTATSIEYSEIPLYSAQRVDPDTISPTGEYELRDSIDFRPRVGDYTDSGAIGSPITKTITPFSFAKRDFKGTNASLVDIPKVDATFSTSFDFYLPQNSSLFLDSEGTFRTVTGAAAENPEKPPVIADAMKLASFRVPQYTFSPLDIGTRKLKHRRYTMKDIGNLDLRLSNVEYYTQLNMLEKETKAYQIQDGDGLDRFKNGFVVDNFTGHGTGDALHPDYKNSIDMANGMLRPEFFHRAVALEETATTDSQRSAVGYQKTGDLITLPYSESQFAIQPYASRVENVNPFNVIAWVGSISLDPASDIWRDTNRLPNLIVNREGNYDTFVARNGGSAINTVWNEWETFWSGEEQKVEVWNDTSWTTARRQVPYRRVMERTITSVMEKDSRSGIRTEIVPRIDYESKGDRVVSVDILPFIRAKSVKFVGRVFKGKTRLYSFFDGVDVGEYVTPDIPYINIQSPLTVAISSGATISTVTIGKDPTTVGFPSSGSITIDSTVYSYSAVTTGASGGFTISGSPTAPSGGHSTSSVVYKTPAAGDPLLTSAGGKVTGTFAIPDPNISGNPAFKVGERSFKLTSDANNGILAGDTQTMGEATYYAKGLLDNIQETIIATRNADVISNTVNAERTRVLSTRVSDRQIGWWDPLAQSFLIDVEGGAFITSIDCYFNSKSETIPVQCQIRTMVNGYPSGTILPFGTAVLDPADVNISDDASASTKFTFPSPVYLMQDVEYCFVIMANTQDYTMWLSHMGELDVGGSRMISDQPYAGVLFKSQNASTWTASQMEDLKFIINRANFSTTEGTVTLQNQALDTIALPANPITTIQGTTKIKVKHPNHGMYSANHNYLTLSNITGAVLVDDGSGGTTSKNLSTLGEFTKTSLLEVGIDHYVIDVSGVGSFGTNNFAESKVTGGSGVTASENYMMDTGKVLVQSIELSGTELTPKIRTTTGTSPSSATASTVKGGDETSFNLTSFTNAQQIALNENLTFASPCMIASQVNETNKLSSSKSFQLIASMKSNVDNLSPVIDTQRMGVLAVQNRINKIESILDLYSTDINTNAILADEFRDSTVAEGDNNAAIYCTRKVTLENAATAIKVIFDAVVFSSAQLKVYYKTLQADETTQFEDIDWVYMNPDKLVSESKGYTDFREYAYEASGLQSYIAFAIKIVMQGSKSTEAPLIRDFRAIALAL